MVVLDRRAGLPVQVNGRGYTSPIEQVTWQTVPAGRQGVDQGAGPGETSLSNDTIWRRSRDDGADGGGQDYADMLEVQSSIFRFRSSLHVNPWTRRAFTILPRTVLSLASANTNLALAVANQGGVDYLFTLDGAAVKRSSAPLVASATFATLTGGAGTYKQITTNGSRVWVCNGTDVYNVDSGTALSLFSTVDTDVIGYANGRLLGAKANVLFELDSGGLQLPIFTHPSSLFVWDGIVTSPAGIYCFGHLGSNSEVYVVTAIDGTGALDVPFYAAGLPDGELLRTLAFYLGVMVLGTSKGLRLAQITGGGFLSFGPVITPPGDVRCLEPQGEDVWFGWSNYTFPGQSATTGLGRARLSRFTADLVPAYATDLMASGTATVLSVATFASKRVFAVSGVGIYAEDTVYETTGLLDYGWFTYGIPEVKLIDCAAIWTDGLNTGEQVTLNVYPDDSTSAVLTGVLSTIGAKSANFPANTQTAAERYRVVATLTAGTAGGTTPTMRRMTLRAVPQPFVAQEIILPVILADQVSDQTGVDYGMDPYDEWVFLAGLLSSKQRFPVSIGAFTATVRMEALEVAASSPYLAKQVDGWGDRQRFLKGKWHLQLITVEPTS